MGRRLSLVCGCIFVMMGLGEFVRVGRSVLAGSITRNQCRRIVHYTRENMARRLSDPRGTPSRPSGPSLGFKPRCGSLRALPGLYESMWVGSSDVAKERSKSRSTRGLFSRGGLNAGFYSGEVKTTGEGGQDFRPAQVRMFSKRRRRSYMYKGDPDDVLVVADIDDKDIMDTTNSNTTSPTDLNSQQHANKIFPKPLVKQKVVVEIEDLAFGGKGIARVATSLGLFVLFIPNTIPGQIVKARVTKSKKDYGECKVLEVIRRSVNETDIPFQPIPGAPYARLPIQVQEKYKLNLTLDLFQRMGRISGAQLLFDSYISAPNPWNYRNKVEYSFSRDVYHPETRENIVGFGLGYKRRGSFWLVENVVKDTGIFDASFENKMPEIRTLLEKSGLPAYYNKLNSGFFRNLVVRKSFVDDKLLINLVTTSENCTQFDQQHFKVGLLDILGEKRVGGILHTVNDDIGDSVVSPRNGSTTLLHGSDTIRENILGLDFQISSKSFFQTNPLSAIELYTKALNYVMDNQQTLKPGSILMDLFCGTGTIAQLLAKTFPKAKVIGVEIVKEAVMDAKLNAQKNGLKNVEFFDQDVGKFLSMNRNGSANGTANVNAYGSASVSAHGSDIHTLVLDPPRGGIAPKALKRVIGLGASQIVYVSCNPASQVRDAMVLEEAGYSLHKFSLVDQFPHTSHIETVALFRKRQPATSGSEANLLDLDRNPDILDLPDIDDRRF
ncbi:hypothetical protein AAMO2058_000930700 [Amorphochlora amoebiformis]